MESQVKFPQKEEVKQEQPQLPTQTIEKKKKVKFELSTTSIENQ